MAQALLTQNEVNELIVRFQSGDKLAGEKLVERNMGLIWNVVHRHRIPFDIEKEDIFQVAVIGFMKALDKFDVNYGVKLSTYAIPLMIGEVKRFIRDHGIIKFPRATKELAYKLIREELVDLDMEEIKSRLKELEVEADEDTINDALFYLMNKEPSSLDKPTNTSNPEDSDVTLLDQLPSDINRNWVEYMELQETISMLTERQQEIIRMRYFEDKIQSEVAEKLNISQVQVSRLERQAIKELRLIMSSDEGNKKTVTKLKDENVSKGEVVDMATAKRGRKAKGDTETAIKLLRETNLNFNEISERTGVSYSSVRRWSLTYRPEEKREVGTRKPLPEEKKQRLVYLLTSTSKSLKEIAKETGIPYSTVGSYGKIHRPASFYKKAKQTKKEKEKEKELKVTMQKKPEEVKVENIEKAKVDGEGETQFNFNVRAEGEKVPKEEAANHIRNAVNLLNMVQKDEVSFKVEVRG